MVGVRTETAPHTGGRTRSARALRRGLVGVAALAALGLGGCPCDSGYPDLFYDGLQEVCDGVPCGWTVDAGDVASVETFHSGERGVQLAVSGELSRPLPELRVPVDGMVSLLAACDAQTVLVIEVDGMTAVPDGTSEVPEEVTLVARREAQPEQGLGGILGRVELPLANPVGNPAPVDALQLRIYVEGPGACVVDEIHIVSGTSTQCMG